MVPLHPSSSALFISTRVRVSPLHRCTHFIFAVICCIVLAANGGFFAAASSLITLPAGYCSLLRPKWNVSLCQCEQPVVVFLVLRVFISTRTFNQIASLCLLPQTTLHRLAKSRFSAQPDGFVACVTTLKVCQKGLFLKKTNKLYISLLVCQTTEAIVVVQVILTMAEAANNHADLFNIKFIS